MPEQSLISESLARILGMQPGGGDGVASNFGQQAAPTTTAQPVPATVNPLTAAPAAVGDLNTQNQIISNTQPKFEPPDVIAARAALAASQQQLAALTPAATPAATTAPRYNLYTQGRYTVGGPVEVGTAANQWRTVTQANMTDPEIRAAIQRDLANTQKATIFPQNALALANATSTYQNLLNPGAAAAPAGLAALPPLTSLRNPAATAAVVPAPLAAPTRPAGNISWQQDQQYWRDLDAFNKAKQTGNL